MKAWKKIAAVACSALMLFSVAACSRGSTEEPTGTISVSDGEVPYTGGTHLFDVTKTNSNIVQNGKSEYKIVYPEDAQSEVLIAADEVSLWIQQSTGVILESVADTGLSYSEGAKYISLGDTALAEGADLSLTEDVGSSGYQIKTKGNSVFVLGHTQKGVLFGAYELLYRLVNFRTYSSDEYAYDELETVPFYEMDITDIPDFDYRVTSYGLSTNDAFLARRLRYNQSADVWASVDGATWHNTFKYLPKEKYQADHPKWYSVDANASQLCFLAHGDEKEAELLYQTLLAKLIESLEEMPDSDNITITQQDVRTWCTCPACTANKQKYGTDAATIVQFCNRISEDVDKYMAENHPGRQINICFFAYHMTTNPPVVENADGTYSPVDDSVICNDNVCVFYAPIDADYSHSFYEPENSSFAKIMDGWKVLSKKLYLWLYSTNFNFYLYPYNSFNSMQGNYWFALDRGGSYMFDQGQWNTTNSTGWGRLKVWLNSKLQWDSSQDMNTLIDEFFTNYYKQAAQPMRELLELYRVHSAYLEEDLGLNGGIYNDYIKTEYWPQATLEMFLDKIDEAYAAIEPLRTSDPEEYQALYDRICLESIAYRYLYLMLYAGRLNTADEQAEKLSMKEDCTRLKITKVKEGSDITELWTSWGIA